MYPKQHPTDPAQLRNSMDFKKQQKRDQLTSLLVNKFRNKYLISLQTERALDEQIQSAVITMVARDANMTERSLHALDRQLAQIVNDFRGTSNAGASKVDLESTKKEIDAISQKSKMSRTASQAAPSSKHLVSSEGGMGRTIQAMTQGKGVGMSEQEWNNIVMQNVAADKAERERKAALVAKQREDMKAELARQVEIKREMAAAQKRKEMSAFTQDIGLNNKRMDDEAARRVAAKQKYFNSQGYLSGQVTFAKEMKCQAVQDEKIADIHERNRIDSYVKDKQEEERKAADQKRLQLKQITEQDRKLKEGARVKISAGDEVGKDLLSSVFEPKNHQAYSMRARQDKIANHIQQKFDYSDERKVKLLEGKYAQAVDKEEQVRYAKQAQRRQHEIQVKAALDDQVRRAGEMRAMEKDEVKKVGARIQEDVDRYEAELVVKKREQRDINKTHQQEVTRQIDERKRLLKHVGSQIVKD